MHDRDVRSAVLQMLDAQHRNDAGTRIVQEMGVWSGSVRIDIAVINGELSGFELKSDRDTLHRLPQQADIYSRVFDKLSLVVGNRHAGKVLGYIPDWWGVIVATQKMNMPSVSLETLRLPQINPDPDPYLVAQLLWKDEALSVLEQYGLAKGWRGKRIKAIHQRLAAELSYNVLALHVREALKQRSEWLRQLSPRELDVPIDADLNPVL